MRTALRTLALACAALGVCAIGASDARATPALPHLFADHMVVQRDRPIAVWGKAEPSERIVVTLGEDSRAAVTGPDGGWSVSLPARPAGGPYTLTVAGTTTVVIRDVLVGEVWVASGQSNMDYTLSRDANASAEIAAANVPEIRLFHVPLTLSTEPRADVDAVWQRCTPETVTSFSAVAYSFGRDLHRALGVPVGIIQTTWSGTGAELWTDPASLAADTELRPILAEWDAAPARDKTLADTPLDFRLEVDDVVLVGDGSTPDRVLSAFDDGRARTSTGGYWTATDVPGCAFEIAKAGFAQYAGAFRDGSGPALDATFAAEGHAIDLGAYGGIRFRIRGTGVYRIHVSQPTIDDYDTYSSADVVATDEWQTVTVQFKDLKQAGWGVVKPLTISALSGFSIDVLRGPGWGPKRPPSGLFNGMIAPLTRFPIAGAIWYQGESNAGNARQYRRLLPAMIGGWRRAWGVGDFPFLIVQLPNFGKGPVAFDESGWAELRESQLLTLASTSNTGMAVTIDLGEGGSLHPPRKVEIGGRLALWALATTYNQKVEYSGPIFQSAEFRGPSVAVTFSHVGSGLKARDGGKLEGFVVAGDDRVFHPATAFVDGESVVVTSAEVARPVAVRYAWAGNPACNLVNGVGLPASPFRTDDWRRR